MLSKRFKKDEAGHAHGRRGCEQEASRQLVPVIP